MSCYPLVSILIPTFNQDLEILKECVDSALCQSYENIEVIISNNCSTNGTKEFLRSYTSKKLKVVEPDKFVPMNVNFDFCARHAQGDYLSFLSSDDVLMTTAIEVLIGMFAMNPNVAFGCGNIFYARHLPKNLGSRKNLIRDFGADIKYVFDLEAKEFFFPWAMSSTWMAGDLIRRRAYEATGGLGCCNYNSAGDVWLTEKLLALGGFAYAGQPLALFRSRAVGHAEVDPDRRLLDFLDQLIMSEDLKGEPNNFRKCRQMVVLAYYLGAKVRPTNRALAEAGDVFLKYSLEGLLWELRLFRNNPFIYRLLSDLLGWFKILRDTKIWLFRDRL